MKTQTEITPLPWWIAYGQAYSGNGIDNQIGVLKADRDEPRTMPTERDANLEFAVRAVNEYDALNAVAEAAKKLEIEKGYSENCGCNMCSVFRALTKLAAIRGTSTPSK